jgi:hypothetical protein
MNRFVFCILGSLILVAPATSRGQIPAARQNPLWVERDSDGSVKVDGPQNQTFGPCEELGNPTLSTDKRITIQLNQRERELIHLALSGFRADIEHEREGVGGWQGGVFPPSGFPQEPDPSIASANPAFFARAFFLNYFIKVTVPSLSERVYGMDLLSDTGTTGDATKEQLKASLQTVTFTACERAALSIALEKWSDKDWGQMGRHLRLCDHSQEMSTSSACESFRPLGDAYRTLGPKIEKDQ